MTKQLNLIHPKLQSNVETWMNSDKTGFMFKDIITLRDNRTRELLHILRQKLV